jgi:hypothetical protein
MSTSPLIALGSRLLPLMEQVQDPQFQPQQGDTIIVEVNNRLITESFAIHWHGIRQVELYFPFSHLSFFFLNQYLQTLCMINFSCLLICAIHHREERLGVMEQHG